jgi:hypothetical protein
VFKTKFSKLEKELTAQGGDASKLPKVLLNPGGKPRKGTFEVRFQGEALVSLQAMPRPFTPLRELDLVALAAKILRKLR